MRRPKWMSFQRFQHLARRSIKWDRIRYWPQTVEVVFAVCARGESSPEVHVRLVRILLFIQSIGRRMPDIYDRALNRLSSLEICDRAVHPRAIALIILEPVNDA